MVLSIAGYVPKHATKTRTIVMLLSLFFYFYITDYYSFNFNLAVIYYLLSETLYIGFIFLVLRKNGLKHFFIKWKGENKGYLIYEGILGFLFFNNAASMGYLAFVTSGNLFDFMGRKLLILIALILFVVGFTVKIWAAKTISIDIYYWRDMFLGRKISKFKITGPYKYLNHPMYGIGQLQSYAIALFYNSFYGLIAALLNQALVFFFYHAVEKKFIKRVY